MHGLGMQEFVVFLLIALLFFGGSRLPGVAAGLGGVVDSFKKAIRRTEDDARSLPAPTSPRWMDQTSLLPGSVTLVPMAVGIVVGFLNAVFGDELSISAPLMLGGAVVARVALVRGERSLVHAGRDVLGTARLRDYEVGYFLYLLGSFVGLAFGLGGAMIGIAVTLLSGFLALLLAPFALALAGLGRTGRMGVIYVLGMVASATVFLLGIAFESKLRSMFRELLTSSDVIGELLDQHIAAFSVLWFALCGMSFMFCLRGRAANATLLQVRWIPAARATFWLVALHALMLACALALALAVLGDSKEATKASFGVACQAFLFAMTTYDANRLRRVIAGRG
jgi:sec-independent protein translocase protein TatA